MADASKSPCPEFDGLRVAIENEDWIAIEATPADLKKLADVLLDLARDDKGTYRVLDAKSPSFQNGSFGLTIYRRLTSGCS